MRQFASIAANAFLELVRQPVFLLLTTGSSAFIVFLACVSYFGFGDEPKLVKTSALAVLFLSGLFAAVMSASASVAREIRSGTALSVLAKPVSRANFILAKYAGLAAAVTLHTYVNAVAALLASKMAFDAYGSADLRSLAIFGGAVALGFGAAGFSNYFLRRTFVSDATFAVTILVTLAFVIVQLTKVPSEPGGPGTTDWRLIPASGLILFALWLAAGIALACSTRFDMMPTLAICTALFLLGLISDYLFGTRSERGIWWASVLYTITPNWQLFWLGDALDAGKRIPGAYLLKAFGYMVAYLGAALAAALMLFQDRELS